MKLRSDERVLSAWAERCSGPGWTNRVVWVLISGPSEMRIEAVQPTEQTEGMMYMFGIADEVARAMKAEAEALARGGRG